MREAFPCLAECVVLVLVRSLAQAKRAPSIHSSTRIAGLLKEKYFSVTPLECAVFDIEVLNMNGMSGRE